jgi:hypothetical protein
MTLSLDLSGHKVFIREGTAKRIKAINVGPFGYQHMKQKHDMDLDTAFYIIQNTHAISQGNDSYLYEEYFQDPTGGIDQWVLVFENRTTQAPPDHHEIGLITGYCQGPGHSFEATCPSWVNGPLGPGGGGGFI